MSSAKMTAILSSGADELKSLLQERRFNMVFNWLATALLRIIVLTPFPKWLILTHINFHSAIQRKW